MWSYFDLNNRALKSRKALEELKQTEEERDSIAFDGERNLDGGESPDRRRRLYDVSFPVRRAKRKRREYFLSPIRQIIMYFGIFIGVLFSTAINQFVNGALFNINITVGTVAASAIIALIIIPIVYEKLSLNPTSPFIVQFGFFVQNGVFWHVIINSIAKIA